MSSHRVRSLGLSTLLSFTIHADCHFKKVSKLLQILFSFFRISLCSLTSSRNNVCKNAVLLGLDAASLYMQAVYFEATKVL